MSDSSVQIYEHFSAALDKELHSGVQESMPGTKTRIEILSIEDSPDDHSHTNYEARVLTMQVIASVKAESDFDVYRLLGRAIEMTEPVMGGDFGYHTINGKQVVARWERTDFELTDEQDIFSGSAGMTYRIEFGIVPGSSGTLA